MRINGQTRIVAVLGHPIAHTASPAMHNAAFAALGLNWRYLAFDVEPSRLRMALDGLATLNAAGVNLTVPHKILAVRLLDEMDESVRQSGAANTIHFTAAGGRCRRRGFNTDGFGLLKALRAEFSFHPRGRTAAVLGCGGAGRGAAIQLALAGARKLILLNRTRSRSRAVAREIRALRLPTVCVFAPEPCDLAVQATSLGLKPGDPLPISRADLGRLAPRFFFEMIYRPVETPVMRLAARLKCRTANGLEMLLYQGSKAFEIWTGRKAPIKVMRAALRREVYGR